MSSNKPRSSCVTWTIRSGALRSSWTRTSGSLNLNLNLNLNINLNLNLNNNLTA